MRMRNACAPPADAAASARRLAPSMPSWRAPTLSTRRRPTRSCSTTSRSCLRMVPAAPRRPQRARAAAVHIASQTLGAVAHAWRVLAHVPPPNFPLPTVDPTTSRAPLPPGCSPQPLHPRPRLRRPAPASAAHLLPSHRDRAQATNGRRRLPRTSPRRWSTAETTVRRLASRLRRLGRRAHGGGDGGRSAP